MSTISVNGVTIEMSERGAGRPLLFLHPFNGSDPEAAALDLLAQQFRVIAPTHPGFGNSDLPLWLASVDDLSYFYLDLMDQLDLNGAVVVGVSFGGWIAAEIAVKTTTRISHLILANAVGIKLGDRETRDIADIFAMLEPQFNELAYADPTTGERDYKTLPEAAAIAAARNREATAKFGWQPYLHNPRLMSRLHRIRVPTLFLWGAQDRLTRDGYGRGYCDLIAGARFETIERAGHFPHLEQPRAFADRITAFATA